MSGPRVILATLLVVNAPSNCYQASLGAGPSTIVLTASQIASHCLLAPTLPCGCALEVSSPSAFPPLTWLPISEPPGDGVEYLHTFLVLTQAVAPQAFPVTAAICLATYLVRSSELTRTVPTPEQQRATLVPTVSTTPQGNSATTPASLIPSAGLPLHTTPPSLETNHVTLALHRPESETRPI